MSNQVNNTTPEEFLNWIGPWALEKAASVINQTGEFGRPMLFGLAEDGTHHVSVLAFWSFKNQEKSMEFLRQVVAQNKLNAVALLSKGRLNRENQVSIDSMVLVKSSRGGVPKMEIYLPESSDGDTIKFADKPSEVMEEISGQLTKFWD